MRVAIYARVSTRDQQAAGQLEELRRFVQANNWRLAGEYLDIESGATEERPQFKRLFEDARRRLFDLVLFWSLDRFSREGAAATLRHLNTLEAHGVAFRSYTEQYLDSCGLFREAVVSILAVIARQERVRISERTRLGIACARLAGKQIGRPRRIFDRAKVEQARTEGAAWSRIAAELGISVATLRRRLRQATAATTARPASTAPTISSESPIWTGATGAVTDRSDMSGTSVGTPA